jgi:hypothetical protein
VGGLIGGETWERGEGGLKEQEGEEGGEETVMNT